MEKETKDWLLKFNVVVKHEFNDAQKLQNEFNSGVKV